MPLRRSFRGRRRRTRKSGFTKRVLRAELSNASTKKKLFINYLGTNLNQGDGTTRDLIIFSPLTNLVQGDGVVNFTGRSIYPKGIQLRGAVSVPTTTSPMLRWTFFWSRSTADYGIGGTVFNSTTRAAAGPVQVPPFANPRVFDSVTVAASPFVGDSFATQFDNTNIKIIKTWTKVYNSGGAATPSIPFKKFIRFPKRRITFQDPAEQSLTSAPNFPMNGNYYLILQAFGVTGASNISATTIATIDLNATLYWKDISG